jgi:ApbE superfamily uncharacterized protein (UPF0280 family)
MGPVKITGVHTILMENVSLIAANFKIVTSQNKTSCSYVSLVLSQRISLVHYTHHTPRFLKAHSFIATRNNKRGTVDNTEQ